MQDLQLFLQQVSRFGFPERERTLFAIGGRGYYENAASDLLAFFLAPAEVHGLGSAFLQAFFDCMSLPASGALLLDHAEVRREVVTKGGRIDLLITGADWCLVIENKIHHAQLNPFSDYEAHAEKMGKARLLFVILSPSGHRSGGARWVGVSYRDYCRRLREHVAPLLLRQAPSKWHVFAREFILHLETELYSPVMTPEQVAFFERHTRQIEEVKKLDAAYRQFLLQDLRAALNELGGQACVTRDDTWCVRCADERWGRCNIAFHRMNESGQEGFGLTVYLIDLGEGRFQEAARIFGHMKAWTEGAWRAWRTIQPLPTRQAATAELRALAQAVTQLLDNARPPDAG